MVWRPADGNETSGAYLTAMQVHAPSILALSRQNLPQLEGSSIEKAAKGGYVLKEAPSGKKADLTLVSTGSEVAIALEAANKIEASGKTVRLVSLPCFEAFDLQSRDYKMSVFPDGHPVMSVEAMSTQGWCVKNLYRFI
jgi:transketolase